MPRHRRLKKWALAHRTTRPRHRKEWNDVDATKIFITNIAEETRRPRAPGFCVDIGAPKSVIGHKELKRIFTRLGRRTTRLRKSNNRFRFADTTLRSLGQVSLPLATPPGKPPISVTMDVVPADIPPLLGMDVLDRESLTPDTVANRLTKRARSRAVDGTYFYYDEWHVPLFRSRSNHIYAEMDCSTNVMFTRSQLAKLHKQFFHPSAEKLFNLLRRARPEEVTPETLTILQDLAKRCDPCQRIQSAPTRFRVSFGAENVRFNDRFLLDIVTIDGKPVLHIVDEGTRFSAARFVPDVSTKTIWATILDCWAMIYTGLPNRMLVDQGSYFGNSFVNMGAISNVEVESTGIEAHQALVSAKDTINLSETPTASSLQPWCLESSRKHIPTRKYRINEQLLRRELLLLTQPAKEMEKHMSEMRVKRALRHKTPRAADKVYQPGDKVLVWREKIVNKRIGEWLGPFTVAAVNEAKKQVYVQDTKIGNARPFNVVQVKLYLDPEMIAHCFMGELQEKLSTFGSAPAQAPDTYLTFFLINLIKKKQKYLTEVLAAGDPRGSSPEMTAAKKAEIKSLLERGTFKVILKEEVPPDGNVLPGRFVLAINSTVDGKIKYKARYVIGGHRDKLKDMIVHSTSTLQPQSIRLLLALAVVFNFDVWTSDVRHAYLQSSAPLARDIFIKKPVAEFELDPSQCLQLLKPLYGLCESGDLWQETIDKHHRNDLGMTPLRSDPALYTLMTNGLLKGLSGGYVDILIRTGDDEFKKLSRKTNKRFDMAEDADIPCTFTGFSLSRDSNGTIIQDQHQYLRKLEQLPFDATFSHFRSMRMRLAWLANTRPDCMLEISQLAQITEGRFENSRREVIKRLNKAVKFAVENRVSMKVPKLNKSTLRVVGYSDSSFANNADLSSQLGYICFLGDHTGTVVPIIFKSYKSRRITRSAMAGEVIAFSDLFDVASTLAAEVGKLVNTRIPVQLPTDSKSLFDVISKGSRTSEKRMMLDIAAAREGFKEGTISDIGFVRSSQNLADCLTKAMHQRMLQTVLREGRLDVKPEQWIIKK